MFGGKLESLQSTRQKAWRRVNGLVSELEKALEEAEQAEEQALQVKQQAEIELQEAQKTQETVRNILGEVNE